MLTIFNTVMFSFNHLLIMMFLIMVCLQINFIPVDKVISKKEFTLQQKPLSGSEAIWYTIFFVIAMNNILTLLPSVHSFTVTIFFNVTCAFMVLIMIWIHSFSYDLNKFFSKVNVLTTSKLFSMFLAMIEFVSFFIRPVTLAVRLSANIIAGHVIFALIMFLQEPYLLALSIFFTLFETFVALIQGYIFITLIKLYSE